MFIDIHVHTTVWPGPARAANAENYARPEQLIEMYDAVGIAMAVMLPSTNPEGTHVIQSNEEIIEIARQHPGRLIAFCNLDPRLLNNSPATDFAYLLDYYKGEGCKGVGEVCCNLYFDDPVVVHLFDQVEKAGLPLDFHVATRLGGTYGLIDDLRLPRFEKQVQTHPKLTFLCHSQAFWSEVSGDVTEQTRGGYPKGRVVEGGKAVELIREYDNVFGDLSAGSGYNAVSRDPEFGYWFLTECQDKLLFGTDVCAPKNRDNVLILLKKFLEDARSNGRISQAVFDKITHQNAARLLGLRIS
ncbi:MAG: hypothetical protein FJ272_14195 [Planctomycetes bacterium]|nr:hypothetical protein [Planctomycetota bacterium]MBM4095138.1 hypothetical protein [Planctomycetota bacterium]